MGKKVKIGFAGSRECLRALPADQVLRAFLPDSDPHRNPQRRLWAWVVTLPVRGRGSNFVVEVYVGLSTNSGEEES